MCRRIVNVKPLLLMAATLLLGLASGAALAQLGAAGDAVTTASEAIRGDVILPLGVLAVVILAVLAWFSRGLALLGLVAVVVMLGVIAGADDFVNAIYAFAGGGGGGAVAVAGKPWPTTDRPWSRCGWAPRARPCILGVPQQALILNVVINAELFLITGNWFFYTVTPAIVHAVFYLVCMHDPWLFAVVWTAWGRCPGGWNRWRVWHCNSYCP